MIPVLLQRTTSAVLLIGLLLAALFWLPPIALLPLLLAVAALACFEFFKLLPAANIPRYPWIGTFCGLLFLAGVWFEYTQPALVPPAVEPLLLFLLVAIILLRQFPQKENPRPLETMAGTIMGVLYAPFLLSFFPRLMFQWGAASGGWLILYLVFVVKMSDVGAYFVGCTLGRHKLCPRISPKKTWEGFFGGLVFALATSVIWWKLAHGHLGALAITLPHALVLGLLLALMGVLGDLAESILKRAANVKDSASYIQGMGGILDVLDSLLLAAPTLYAYALLFLKPAT
jgi:phosphatidate cytidylyltransferase